jgi:translocation and assembly module TamA
MRSPDGPFRQRRIRHALPILVLAAGTAHAARVGVQLDGVDGVLRDAVMAGLELAHYGERDVSAAQARRLYEHAEAQVR